MSIGRALLSKGLYHQDCILTFKVPIDSKELAQLVALNTKENRVKLVISCPQCKFMIRNDSRYLFIGLHDAMNNDGRHEWVWRGWDFTNDLKSNYVQLTDFVRTNAGQSVSFQIYDGFFYATSQSLNKETDETSYYHCLHFPNRDSSPDTTEF